MTLSMNLSHIFQTPWINQMTVKDLIEELNKVEDKEIDVFLYSPGCPAHAVIGVDLKTANENKFCPLTTKGYYIE